MPDLTETQLARIRDGATLVATAAERDVFAVLMLKPCPFSTGAPIHPSLPGLTWGRSLAVRLSDLTTDIALQLGFDGGLKPSEVYGEWFWLTEVKRPCM